MEKFLFFAFALGLSGLFACSHSQISSDPADTASSHLRIDSSTPAEVRAVLVNIIAVSKGNDEAGFRKLILPRAVEIFDANQWDFPGFYQRYMAAIASIRPRDYGLMLEGDRATFKGLRKDPKTGDSQTIELILVRDGGGWKIAAPPSPPADTQDSLSLQTVTPKNAVKRKHAARTSSPRSTR